MATTDGWTRALGLLAVVAGVAMAAPALAHHSFALFDHEHRITVAGTVAKFEWTNPHVYIELNIPDDKGGVRRYTVECASPNILKRVGWKFNELKFGDRVTLLVNPLRNGDPGGMLEQATLPDGRVLGDGNPPGGVVPRQ